MGLDSREKNPEVMTRELPLEGLGGDAVVILKAQQSILDLGQGMKIVGREHLALNEATRTPMP